MRLYIYILILSNLIFGQLVWWTHSELEWKTIETEHFKIHFYDKTERSAREAAEIAEYVYPHITKVYDLEWVGQLFMTKAVECVNEKNTLQGIIEIQPSDNKTKTDNDTIINTLPEPEDAPTESLPDQPKEEPSESPETIFQG